MNDTYSEIQNAPSSDYYELSYAQKWIWLSDRLSPEKPKRNISFSLHFKGRLDIEALEQAVEALVIRHEILRTTFAVENGTLRQRICPPASFNIKVNHIDVSKYERMEELSNEIIQEEQAFPFDVQADQLLRVTLIRLLEPKFILVFSMHAIISDDHSMVIIANELLTLYKGYREQGRNILPPLSIQYKDFVAWQNAQPQHHLFGEQESYWMDHFSGRPVPTAFPADFPGNSRVFSNADYVTFQLDKSLTAALTKIAERNNASLLVVLVAIINVLLNRYTREKDIIIGASIASRPHPEVEGQVGPYNSIFPVRTLLDTCKDCFSDVLETIRDVLTAAYERNRYPYELLMEKLGLMDNLSGCLLINVLVHPQQAPLLPEVPELTIERYALEGCSNRADLTFRFEQVDNTVKARIEYNGGLFKRNTINQFVDNLVNISRLLATEDELFIDNVKLLQIAPIS